VSDGGQVDPGSRRRHPHGQRAATKGVTILQHRQDERVVSLIRISEPEHDEELDEEGCEGVSAAPEAGETAPEVRLIRQRPDMTKRPP